MKAGANFPLAVLVVCLLLVSTLVLTGGAIWLDLSVDNRTMLEAVLAPRLGLAILILMIICVSASFFLKWAWLRYDAAPLLMVDRLRLMLDANPQLRLAAQEAPQLAALALAINRLADQRDALRQDMAEKVRNASRSIEEEKNRLAALMSELGQSVIVCNLDGRILLYNQHAFAQFGTLDEDVMTSIGLGRSIFALLDPQLIAHALEHLQGQIDSAERQPLTQFVATLPSGQLLRVKMAPVRTVPEEEVTTLAGYVLLLDNITQIVESETRRDEIVRSLLDAGRNALISLRAATVSTVSVDSLCIDAVADSLATSLDRADRDYAGLPKAILPLPTPLTSLAEQRESLHLPHVDSRPEYYDFDLFKRARQDRHLDDSPLDELVYTVFDTETTGLDPSGGDEIIQIGAVRIVNGRLLHHEHFDRLIDPRRPMSAESVAIHGIAPQLLEGQPGIEKILPAFHRFAEDTILVAHNAAFDMRFLQLKESVTGIRFVQPVLDTLLLSALLQPNEESHRLEAIAERFGIAVLGRHTALGDAILTGEVFLRMIPLLGAMNIRTLGAALEASRQTYHARLRY